MPGARPHPDPAGDSENHELRRTARPAPGAGVPAREAVSGPLRESRAVRHGRPILWDRVGTEGAVEAPFDRNPGGGDPHRNAEPPYG
jgi:hypothetical protein